MSAVKHAHTHTFRVKNSRTRQVFRFSLTRLRVKLIPLVICDRSFIFPWHNFFSPVLWKENLFLIKKNIPWKFAASREFYFRSRSTVTSRAPLITFEIKLRFLRSSRHFYRPFSREFVVDLIQELIKNIPFLSFFLFYLRTFKSYIF